MSADALRRRRSSQQCCRRFQPMSRGLFLFQLNLQPVRCRQLQLSFRPIVVYPLPRRHKKSFAWTHFSRCLLSVCEWDLQWIRPTKLQRLPLRLILP